MTRPMRPAGGGAKAPSSGAQPVGSKAGAATTTGEAPPSMQAPTRAEAKSVHAGAGALDADLPSDTALAAIGTVKSDRALRAVPTLATLEALKSGDADRATVEHALGEALRSSDPRVVKRAAKTLQAAESYARKAEQDRANYAGTGFCALPWPGLAVRLDASATTALVQNLVHGRDGKTVDVLALVARRGLVVTEPKDALTKAPALGALRSDASAQLPASDGRESPRRAATFQEEWRTEVVPGLANIRKAIVDTAKANGPGCPFARGNHAKGISFDGAQMKLDDDAPEWARELLGDSLGGGMLRVSGSQTDPNQSDQEAHMPGIRVVFPLQGTLDGSAAGRQGTQLIDLTANTGAVTHAQTAAEHTKFTQNISVPKSGLAGTKLARAAVHLGGAVVGKGSVLDRIGQMRNAVSVTNTAMEHKFHEHELFGRHAFFVGGRYVQVRFAVESPRTFPDPRGDERPNARLDAVSETVAREGLRLAMYVTELPEGRPDLVESEGWQGLPERRLATISVPPQQQKADSRAAQWFDAVPHVPGGADKVFHAAGLGRHRVPVYIESGKVRHGG